MDVGISKRKKGITWRCEKGQENVGKGGYIGESVPKKGNMVESANILEKVSRTPSHRASISILSFIQLLYSRERHYINPRRRSLQCQVLITSNFNLK